VPSLRWALATVAAACGGQAGSETPAGAQVAREAMVREQIEGRGIADPLTLKAMRTVPRHEFVPDHLAEEAYADHPLPIGHHQTISQPYVVAFMTEALGLEGGERVLEIGTGSGYQAAVLAEIAGEVYTIEIVEPLGEEARERLARLGYDNVHVRVGDGYAGWPEAAPFDAVIVTAAAPRIPEPLKRQLREGGKMILPVGDQFQELVVLTRHGDDWSEESVLPVRFVPMTGEVRQ